MFSRAQSCKPSDFPFGRVHEFLVAFCNAGGNPDNLSWMLENKTASKVVGLIRSEEFKSSGYIGSIWSDTEINHRYARDVMGANLFGIEEAIKYFRIDPTREQLKELEEIPFREHILFELRETHVLVAEFPLSILEIQALELGLFGSMSRDWYKAEAFAKEKGMVKWRLICKDYIEGSIDGNKKNWEGLCSLPSASFEGEYVPSARTLLYTAIGRYLHTGDILFRRAVQTSSLSSSGKRIFIMNDPNTQRMSIFLGNWGEGSYQRTLFGSGAMRPLT